MFSRKPLSIAISSLILGVSISSSSYAVDYVVNANSTNQNDGNAFANNDSITINSGVTLDVNGDAITDNGAANLRVDVYGTIIADDGTNEGIELDGSDGHTVNVFSGASVTGNDDGILFDDTSTINIYGSVTANGDDAIYGDDSNTINVYSGGTVTGNDDGIRVDASNTVNIYGSVTSNANASNDDAGVFLNGNVNTVNVFSGGVITGAGEGIRAVGNNNIITIRGTVTSSNAGTGDAVDLEGTGNTLNVYGTIENTAGGTAIEADGGNTVNIYNGAKITGALMATDTTFSYLNIDFGSARSYVLSAQDDGNSYWVINDLSGRSFTVNGTIVSAAAVANVETADESLYNRTSAIKSSLDKYLFSADKNKAWGGVYHKTVERTSGDRAAVDYYRQHISGATFVNPTGYENTQLLLDLQRSEMKINYGTQELDTTSISVGLQNTDLMKKGESDGANVVGRVIVTYNVHDSSQEIMDYNSSTGLTNYYGKYNSLSLVAGATSKVTYKWDDEKEIHVDYDIEIAHERINDYSETATFQWDDRALTQANLGAKATYSFKAGDVDARTFAGASYRALLGGKKQNYSINNSGVSFDGGNINEFTLNVGIEAKRNLGGGKSVNLNFDASRSNQQTTTLYTSLAFLW